MVARSKRFGLMLVLTAFCIGISACDNGTPDAPGDVAPTVISSSAFDFDNESFASTTAAGARGAHHTRAYATVLLVNLAVGVHLVLPLAATNSAGQDTPHVEDGTWIWENSLTVGSSVVDVRLEAVASGSTVNWEMFISSDNVAGQAYDNFSLYTAETQIGGETGFWSLFYNIEGQGRTRVLDADYERDETQHRLTFSIPDTNPNEEAHGASVYYIADGNAREFDYQEPTPSQNHFIEWNAATKAGSITAWNYNSGLRACWDENLDNVECDPS